MSSAAAARFLSTRGLALRLCGAHARGLSRTLASPISKLYDPSTIYLFGNGGRSLSMSPAEIRIETPRERSFFEAQSITWWKKLENQKQFIAYLTSRLGITKPEEFYKVKLEDIVAQGGSRFLLLCEDNVAVIASIAFPTTVFFPWLFDRVPRKFWNNVDNIRQYVVWLGQKLGYSKPDDWYQIRATDFMTNRGEYLLKKYHSSPYELLVTVFPQYQLKPWQFAAVPKAFWAIKENRRAFLEDAARRRGHDPTDFSFWYTIDNIDFFELGGRGLLYLYNDSLYRLLMDSYPEFEFLPWKFKTSPRDLLNDQEAVRKLVKHLEKDLNITKEEDWYRISPERLKTSDAGKLFRHHGVKRVLEVCYPDFAWSEEHFANPWKSATS